MFTVEKERDGAVVVRTIDETAEHEDLEVYIETDGVVFIRQFSEELNEYQLCIINISQLIDVVNSLDAKPGTYRTKIIRSTKV